jgi:hypothetical protein
VIVVVRKDYVVMMKNFVQIERVVVVLVNLMELDIEMGVGIAYAEVVHMVNYYKDQEVGVVHKVNWFGIVGHDVVEQMDFRN